MQRADPDRVAALAAVAGEEQLAAAAEPRPLIAVELPPRVEAERQQRPEVGVDPAAERARKLGRGAAHPQVLGRHAEVDDVGEPQRRAEVDRRAVRAGLAGHVRREAVVLAGRADQHAR
jgi:hypothetical protein